MVTMGADANAQVRQTINQVLVVASAEEDCRLVASRRLMMSAE